MTKTKNTNTVSNTSAAELTLEQLAALSESTAPQFAKTGNPDPNRDDGVIEIGAAPVPVTISGVNLSARTARFNDAGQQTMFATPQVVLTLTLEDGRSTQAAIDLPLDHGGGIAFNMSAEEEETYTERAGNRFLKFLRAMSPGKFNVFASLDKETNPWTYYGFDGEVMTSTQRAIRADQINRAVMVVAGLIRKGDFSQLMGKKVGLARAENTRSAKYPYNNFSAVDAE